MGITHLLQTEKEVWYHHKDVSANVFKGQKTRPRGDREDTERLIEALSDSKELSCILISFVQTEFAMSPRWPPTLHPPASAA